MHTKIVADLGWYPSKALLDYMPQFPFLLLLLNFKFGTSLLKVFMPSLPTEFTTSIQSSTRGKKVPELAVLVLTEGPRRTSVKQSHIHVETQIVMRVMETYRYSVRE